jgi:hypothetical protein
VTGRRVVAVLVAVALVAGALLLRSTVLDDEADGPTATTTPGTAAPIAAAALVCITELEAVCRALASELPDVRITIADAGTTLDSLAVLPDDEPRPLWLTIEPYPAMLDSLRAAANLEPFGATDEAVGSAALAIASSPERSADLIAGCADAPLWRCIGANAGNDWTTIAADAAPGRIRPSIGDADRQAVALASFAAAVAGYYGRPDIRSSDWQDDPSFTPWVSRLLGQVDTAALSAGTPLATMAVRPALDLAATSDGELAALGGDRFVANYPEPSMWVEAVVAVPDRTAVPAEAIDTITAGVASAGWAAPGAATQSLPGPTTMLALRTLWQESTS